MRRGEDEDKHELRDQIGCILVDDDGLSDNLAIVICTYFESHPDKPGSIEEIGLSKEQINYWIRL